MFETETLFAPPGAWSHISSAAERVSEMVAKLRAADALVAQAIDLLGRGGIEAATGLSPEMVLKFQAHCTGGDARTMTIVAGVLRDMPKLSRAFSDGSVSWGQVRAISYAVKRVPVPDRAKIDAFISTRAPQMTTTDPDALVDEVDTLAERLRPDLALKHEDRAISSSFLSVQNTLDGRGMIYGEGDAASIATFAEALDALAPPPNHPDDDGLSRPQQWFGALVAMSELVLSGASSSGLRPRPRLLATLDVAALADPTLDGACTLLASLAGRSPRLTSVATEMLLCDATIVPVVLNGKSPTHVGDAQNTFSDKTRTAVIARDKRCRFCRSAPASWCDVHHIVPGVGNKASDGCLLCRTCHRRVHRYDWRLKLLDEGAIEFKRRGQSFLSLPP